MNEKDEKYEEVSTTIFRKRLRKFRSLRRGYFSFLFLLVMYLISFFCPFLMNNKALIVNYDGKTYFPVFKYYAGREFGQDIYGEADYRKLKLSFEEEGGDNWVLMPPYPYSPYEHLLDLPGEPPHPPSKAHWFGTDTSGRDVFVRLAYGFTISISFALVVVVFCYTIGISIGAMLGYFGGKFDIIMQRFVEIWMAMPFLYTIMIVSSIVQPNFLLLAFVLTLFGWMGMTFYIRGEFYREKAKDYVSAAISMGANDFAVIFKHILPNALTPVISFAPFAVVGYIGALVALDYLGFGLPPPTPSWGQMVQQGMQNIFDWWLVFFPLGALFITLLLVVFIGEAVREAFDPKVFSRLR
jgi:microcin C transport system permease protein